MAKFTFELEVEPREVHGKGASRRLRRLDNMVPGIVYGGEETPASIMIPHHKVLKALSNEAVFSHILTLSLKGKKQKVVLKDVQRHPYNSRVAHMDFMRIDENKAITMHVPLHFLGQDVCPGVVLEGGIVTHHMVEVEVKCLPKDLPEFIEIDLTNAPLDTVVHLSQLTLPKNVDLISVVHSAEDDLPVVSIHKSRRPADEEEEAQAAAAAAPATEVPVQPKGAAAKPGAEKSGKNAK
jgi:large subunit ribosomal protein L25